MGTWETGLALCRTSFSDKALYVTVTTPSLRCTQTRTSNARNPRSHVEEQPGAGQGERGGGSECLKGPHPIASDFREGETRDSRDPEMNELSGPGSIPRVRGRRKSPSGVPWAALGGSGEGS